MHIKVLGPGCANCNKTEKLISEALAESGVAGTLEKVTDFKEIAGMGVFSTPAVIIDDQIQCVGKVPSKKEIMTWLT